jgi:hypothetical protein
MAQPAADRNVLSSREKDAQNCFNMWNTETAKTAERFSKLFCAPRALPIEIADAECEATDGCTKNTTITNCVSGSGHKYHYDS